jgi:hypothetical protein
LDGESILSGPIRQLFLDHDIHERLGVVLLHKHLDIGPIERLVEYGYTSSPWEVGDATSHAIAKYEDRITSAGALGRKHRHTRPDVVLRSGVGTSRYLVNTVPKARDTYLIQNTTQW